MQSHRTGVLIGLALLIAVIGFWAADVLGWLRNY
jgi:hypothetical protein